jgi:AhpD family alkylhydroperoxidase
MNTVSLSPIEIHLIEIRASQINKCAFCIDMHTKGALQIGETAQRIFVLPAWRETDIFNEREQALLAITEEITLISHAGLTEETYQKGLAIFGEEQLAQIIVGVVIINSWNRIALSTDLKF